jgi:hypothetical protein
MRHVSCSNAALQNTLLFIESGFTKPSLTNEVELSLSLSLHDILWFLVDGYTVGPDRQVSIHW